MKNNLSDYTFIVLIWFVFTALGTCALSCGGLLILTVISNPMTLGIFCAVGLIVAYLLRKTI